MRFRYFILTGGAVLAAGYASGSLYVIGAGLVAMNILSVWLAGQIVRGAAEVLLDDEFSKAKKADARAGLEFWCLAFPMWQAFLNIAALALYMVWRAV